MKITFFSDHCVPNSVVLQLRNEGFHVLKLRDHLPVDSPDEIVIGKAQELNTVLLTLDGDFSNIINYPPKNYGGIICLQVRNHPELIPMILNRLIVFLFSNMEIDHYKHKLFIVESYRIRIIG